MTNEQQNDALAGAGGTVNLAGHTFVIHQASPYDLAMFRKFLRKQIKTPLMIVNEMLPTLERSAHAEAIRVGVQMTADQTTEMSPDFMLDVMLEPANAGFLLHLLTRKNHKEWTLPALVALITGDDVPQLLADLFDASGLSAIDPKAVGQRG